MVGDVAPNGGGASADALSAKVVVQNLTIRYGNQVALRGLDLSIRRNEILGVIGPAGSGKTSFLRALNRMDEFIPGMEVEGRITFDGRDIRRVRNVYALRSRIGVVFPLPVGLPLTVYENVALAPRLRGVRKGSELDEIVERCLRRAALWEEVKDRLDSLGSLLSGGQQQRLTIARALSQEPDLLLLDEFSIAVDPVTTMRIEEVLKELKHEMSIVLVTNLVQQARRLADRTAFFLTGEHVETSDTARIFSGIVKDPRTHDYIEGRFG
ncbi:MAG: phosphate ABC transporter ATP-binding protein [Gammaproteobacteria bacterium]|nr:phosphate ABC transporter ATP-binding protein [Gammaproteobacteria bacterium]MDE0650540.1 phosphate ABC transporter ATP-binding protein [Gammaproteobacteria bacterium]